MGLFSKNKGDNIIENLELTKKINLSKEEVHKVCLTKPILNGLKARVCLAIDYSGSMSNLYDNGTVQSIFEKMLPLAMEFDDDGTMESWRFSDGTKRLKDVTTKNISGYVKNYISGSMGGTNYAPVMKEIVNFYYRTKVPVYVIFITDGDNFDKDNATEIIRESSKLPIFWQFIGLGYGGFDYLQRLDDMSGRYVDNADFFEVKNANDITYNNLLNEFPGWLSNDKVKAMLGRQK